MTESPKMTPERIRVIRKHLGLTQVQAGKLLGGGPHAFSRYESGNLKPSAALINLLRVLEAYPRTLQVLNKDGNDPMIHRATSPFDVEARHIILLDSSGLTELLRRLLVAEASANDIPLTHLHNFVVT